MTIQCYDTPEEMIANLNPIELKLYQELGLENYCNLMDMWASIHQDTFDEWYENTDPELAEEVIELSRYANQLTRMLDKSKLTH